MLFYTYVCLSFWVYHHLDYYLYSLCDHNQTSCIAVGGLGLMFWPSARSRVWSRSQSDIDFAEMLGRGAEGVHNKAQKEKRLQRVKTRENIQENTL